MENKPGWVNPGSGAIPCWESILCQEGLSLEVTYLLAKIWQSLLPLLDRLYLKTLKGQELLLEGLEQGRRLLDGLRVPDENFYLLLTDLENTYANLFQKLYEFRVKTG
jgi:hypothetical protein